MTNKTNRKTSTATKAQGATTPEEKPNTQAVVEKAGKKRDRIIAELALSPIMPNTNTSLQFAKGAFGTIDLMQAVDVMNETAGKVKAGDLTRAGTTLIAQAVTLDAIFNELARRASMNMGEYINTMDIYMRLALKAQSQCRATLETLAEIKNPRPVAFVKQANIAHGPQQVNNGAAQVEPLTHAGKSPNPSNELLGVDNGERLDTRAQGAAGAANQELAPVGKIDGATD